jgi:hypothetical protein
MIIAVLNDANVVTNILRDEQALLADPVSEGRWIDVTRQRCEVGSVFDPESGSFDARAGRAIQMSGAAWP